LLPFGEFYCLQRTVLLANELSPQIADSTMKTDFIQRCTRFSLCLFTVLMVTTLVTCSGCVGMIANLLHVGMGNPVRARYGGLKDREVAVVCLSNSSSFRTATAAAQIAKSLEKNLRRQVNDIKVVDQQKIDDWRDRNEWNQIDYIELGRGVGADMVVAIDLGSFSLHEGATLFKGRCDLKITVFDLVDEGKIVYDSRPPQVQYPLNAGQHVADINEREFRNKFIEVVATELAHHFHDYDLIEDYGRDADVLKLSGG
jgi:hypothetical protein